MRWLGMRQEISQLRGWGNIISYIFVQYFVHKKSHKKYLGFSVAQCATKEKVYNIGLFMRFINVIIDHFCS